MTQLTGACREVLEKAEFVTLVTEGDDGPHVVATWGDYVREMGGWDQGLLIIPAGGYRITEQNLKNNGRIQVLAASRAVAGPHGAGQGCLLSGTGEMQSSGETLDAIKARFPWARAALVVRVEDARLQLI